MGSFVAVLRPVLLTLLPADSRTEEEALHWQEDLSIRLLCVLALDRFGDFVSDQACSLLSTLSTLCFVVACSVVVWYILL
jgi:hypothetical protein